MAQVIKPDGTTEEVAPRNGKSFTLEELYKIIGTDIVERLRVKVNKKEKWMVIDEEGKCKNSPFNEKATDIYKSPVDFIVGTVVICGLREFR